ncbi:DUF21 domain-containing protein [Candidatus Nomurabacteria bacterium]|nr:DUF21 domain-containing protein [Candidatus Nomurabacteria bacterium]
MDTIWPIVAAFILLIFSGVFSGLNIGMMMLRPEDLERKSREGDEIAQRVYRYRENGNYLITCILLGNVAVVSAFTLVLESFAGGIIAGIVTTILVTIFGEIVPQSIFSRRGYMLTRYFFRLLDFMFIAMYPLAKPITLMLDRFIGTEPPLLYSREELHHLIDDHAKHSASTVDHDEGQIMIGALHFSQRTAAEVATPIRDVVAVELHDKIDASLVSMIKREGYSRLPVVDDDSRYVGILYAKDILGHDLPVPVSHIYRDKIYDIPADTALDTALSRFIQTKSHLSLVVDDNNEDKPVGILTLEDVVEEILKREIVDEYDKA